MITTTSTRETLGIDLPNDQVMDEVMFRNTVGTYASGITIISGFDSQGPVGFTCQSFYSVSVEPPLVSFSVMRTSTTYPRIRETGSSDLKV